MPLIPYYKEEEIRKEIRRSLIKEPMLTITRLQELLMRKGYFGIHGNALDQRYVMRLVRKIKGDAYHSADRQQIVDRIAQSRERYNLVAERLFKIAFWDLDSLAELIPMPTVAETVGALKAIVELDLKLYDAETMAGLFKKAEDKIIHPEWRNAREIPEEVYENMVLAFEKQGINSERMQLLEERMSGTRTVSYTVEDGNDEPASNDGTDTGIIPAGSKQATTSA